MDDLFEKFTILLHHLKMLAHLVRQQINLFPMRDQRVMVQLYTSTNQYLVLYSQGRRYVDALFRLKRY